MLKFLVLFLFVSVSADAAVLKWDCENENGESSFKISYNTTSERGTVKMTIDGKTETLKIPTALWIKGEGFQFYTSQAFWDETVRVGYKLMYTDKINVKILGKMFFYDTATGNILDEDSMGIFACTEIK